MYYVGSYRAVGGYGILLQPIQFDCYDQAYQYSVDQYDANKLSYNNSLTCLVITDQPFDIGSPIPIENRIAQFGSV